MAGVPWCDTCERFLSPPTVLTGGKCPACGRRVEPGAARVGARSGSHAIRSDDDPVPLPWHFKLLAGALAVYLGYRAFQGIEWLAGQF